MNQGTRSELISSLAGAIRSATTTTDATHPLRVAIDGPPAAGKTTLADELATVLRAQDRDVIRATVDDFLFPRAQRYRRGRYSAEGCYFDAHDRAALCGVLLDPLVTAEIERSWRYRHIPSQQLYFATARPTAHADIIVYNDQLQQPAWEIRPARFAQPGD